MRGQPVLHSCPSLPSCIEIWNSSFPKDWRVELICLCFSCRVIGSNKELLWGFCFKVFKMLCLIASFSSWTSVLGEGENASQKLHSSPSVAQTKPQWMEMNNYTYLSLSLCSTRPAGRGGGDFPHFCEMKWWRFFRLEQWHSLFSFSSLLMWRK